MFLIINSLVNTLVVSSLHYNQLLPVQVQSVVITSLGTLISDIDVAVGCLTCYGALLSLPAPHREMEVWLKDDIIKEWPWIVEHCVQLLQNPCKYLIIVHVLLYSGFIVGDILFT